MRKLYKNQLFTFENGVEVFIKVVVEDGKVGNIIAEEDIVLDGVVQVKKGDIINDKGDESLIRSEDIEVSFLSAEFTLYDIATLQEVAREYNISYSTLHSRIKNKKFNMIENVDFKKLGKRQPILLSPSGINKIIRGLNNE